MPADASGVPSQAQAAAADRAPLVRVNVPAEPPTNPGTVAPGAQSPPAQPAPPPQQYQPPPPPPPQPAPPPALVTAAPAPAAPTPAAPVAARVPAAQPAPQSWSARARVPSAAPAATPTTAPTQQMAQYGGPYGPVYSPYPTVPRRGRARRFFGALFAMLLLLAVPVVSAYVSYKLASGENPFEWPPSMDLSHIYNPNQ